MSDDASDHAQLQVRSRVQYHTFRHRTGSYDAQTAIHGTRSITAALHFNQIFAMEPAESIETSIPYRRSRRISNGLPIGQFNQAGMHYSLE